MVVIPYQSAPDPPVTPELRSACSAALHVVLPGGTVLRAGRAVAAVVAAMGWRRLARVVSVPPLSWAVEACYAVVARNRRLVSRVLGLQACSLEQPADTRNDEDGDQQLCSGSPQEPKNPE